MSNCKKKSFWSDLRIHPISAGVIVGIAFFVGSALNSGSSTDAAGNGTYLPIIKGGTGVGSLPSGVLVGNGTSPITTKAIDTTAKSGSNNLVTSGGAYSTIASMIQSSILSSIYPVGSIYMSTSSANPSTFIPGTTWAAWGSGRVPVGVNTADGNFNAVEKTGGSQTAAHSHTVTVVNSAASTTGSTALNVNQIPSHTHNPTNYGNINYHLLAWPSPSNSAGQGQGTFAAAWEDPGAARGYFIREVSMAIGNTGGGQGHTHTVPAHGHTASSGSTASSTLQPYITAYMWKRTK